MYCVAKVYPVISETALSSVGAMVASGGNDRGAVMVGACHAD